MTFDRIAARRRADAATEGPWIATNDPEIIEAGWTVQTPVSDPFDGLSFDYQLLEQTDAEFIAAARSDLPAALDRLDACEACITTLVDDLRNGLVKHDYETWVAHREAAVLLLARLRGEQP